MKRILLQLDNSPTASVFDSVVACDAGVDVLLRQTGVTADAVESHVHGAIFTRGPDTLHNTAIFLGGEDVAAVDQTLARVRDTFFGPMRVSVLCDPNGSNTTAAAAVHLASRHVDAEDPVVVLGSGPVGGRVARMTAGRGRPTTILGRDAGRSADAASVAAERSGGTVSGTSYETDAAADALREAAVLIACGKAGVEMMADWRERSGELSVAIDLNAVPPAGLPGIEPGDFAQTREGVVCYGAIGVGGPKMKVHKEAVRRLFTANDHIFDAEELLKLADERLADGEQGT